MDLRTIADLIISVILLGALGAGSRGLWVYGKTHDETVKDLKTAHERELTNLKTTHDQAITDLKSAHALTVAGLEAVIADLKIRVEAGDVTASRLMELTFRSVLSGEKAADTAVTALRGKA